MRVTLSLPESATAEELLEEIDFFSNVVNTIFAMDKDAVVHVGIDPDTVSEQAIKPVGTYIYNNAAPDLANIPTPLRLVKTTQPQGFEYD
jgi:hypothetical protein